MTHAYFEDYLRGVMRNLGVMAHFCINEYGMSPEEFAVAFAKSEVVEQITNVLIS